MAFCYFLELLCGILLFFRTVLWHFVIFWNCSVAFCYFLELFCGILLFFLLYIYCITYGHCISHFSNQNCVNKQVLCSRK